MKPTTFVKQYQINMVNIVVTKFDIIVIFERLNKQRNRDTKQRPSSTKIKQL